MGNANSDFQNALDSNKNGFNDFVNNTSNDIQQQFDPNNDNGALGKIKMGTDEAFQRGGRGNGFLRKAGEFSGQASPIVDGLGNVALAGLVLFPEASPLLAPVFNILAKKLPQVADTIEKPKKDLKSKDITDTIFM